LTDIAVVRSSNSVIYDPRVNKIISSLKKRYSVLALGWDRQGVSQQFAQEYMVELKLFRLRTSFWKPSLARMIARLLLFFPLFWVWVFIYLLRYRPKVVHACDLDVILPCYIYKKILRKKLVFDIFDRYAMVFIPPKYKTIYSFVNSIEEIMSLKSDAVIVAGGAKILQTFKEQPKRIAVILNCPEDYYPSQIANGSSVKGYLTLVYTGGIRRGRGLENLSDISSELNDIIFVLAGPIMDKDVFDEIRGIDNLKYEGVLQPADALGLEARSDAILALYDPQVLWNNITLPNKLFEAMMCGVPIITNIATEIVNETQCGIIVDYDNKDEMKKSIVELRDNPKLKKRLGENGREAFLRKYNWTAMEQKLYGIYEQLVSPKSVES
jgi:glycosyltransferase involved in cell wall biosynthesis